MAETPAAFTEVKETAKYVPSIEVLVDGEWQDLDASQPMGLREGELVRMRLLRWSA